MDNNDINSLVAFFLSWERTSRDTIDFKKIYVDMAGGDLVAGLVLSQVVYWHLPGADGVTRLRVDKDSHKWIAKKREDWWDEIRISPKQLDRALDVLEELKLVATGLYGFAGTPTKHVRLDWHGFILAWQAILTKGENAFLPLGNLHFDLSSNSNTENTTETTNKENAGKSPAAPSGRLPSFKPQAVSGQFGDGAINDPEAQAGRQRENPDEFSPTDLETYIAKLMRLQKGRVPAKCRNLLVNKVISKKTGATLASLEDNYTNEPEAFSRYIDEQYTAWIKAGGKDVSHFLHRLRMYIGWYVGDEFEGEDESPASSAQWDEPTV